MGREELIAELTERNQRAIEGGGGEGDRKTACRWKAYRAGAYRYIIG